MFRRLAKIIGAIRSAEAWHGLWTWQVLQVYILPALYTAAAVVIGWVQQTPVAYLMAAAALTFTVGVNGMLAWSKWRERNSLDGKFRFSQPYFHFLFSTEDGMPLGVQMGAEFENIAHFPMKVRVLSARTSFNNRIPEHKKNLINSYEVKQGKVLRLTDNFIDIREKVIPAVTGEIDIEFEYWRSPFRKRREHLRRGIRIGFGPDGKPTSQRNWVLD